MSCRLTTATCHMTRVMTMMMLYAQQHAISLPSAIYCFTQSAMLNVGCLHVRVFDPVDPIQFLLPFLQQLTENWQCSHVCCAVNQESSDWQVVHCNRSSVVEHVASFVAFGWCSLRRLLTEATTRSHSFVRQHIPNVSFFLTYLLNALSERILDRRHLRDMLHLFFEFMLIATGLDLLLKNDDTKTSIIERTKL